MKIVRLFFTLFFSGIFITSCNDSSAEVSPDAYIGGEIVNAISDYIVIHKGLEPLDTIYLDENNRFSHRIENVDPGLYTLQHGGENQAIYLAPSDSLLFRVNTYDFDESIHFSGRGARKNNFMVNMFLLNEANTDLVLSYYKVPPEEFARKTDSIRKVRLAGLKELDKEYNFPDGFNEIAKKNINYEFYDLRERYTFLLNKYFKEYAEKLTPAFHSYRNDINFNDESLQSSPSYNRLIENYIINRVIAQCVKETGGERACYDLNNIENLKRRIALIDSLTNNQKLKTNFFSKWGAQAMTIGSSREKLVSILRFLQENGLGEEELLELRILGSIQLAFLPGIILDEIPLITTSRDTVDIQEVITKPSIVFIWSVDAPARHQREHEKIVEYRKKYPEVDFIGINIDIGETEKWIETVQEQGYPVNREFQLGPIEMGDIVIDKSQFKYYLNKLLFLNPEGEVIIGDAYLYAPEFESRILELLNQ